MQRQVGPWRFVAVVVLAYRQLLPDNKGKSPRFCVQRRAQLEENHGATILARHPSPDRRGIRHHQAARSRGPAGAPAQVFGIHDRRHRFAPLRERPPLRNLRIHRSAGHQADRQDLPPDHGPAVVSAARQRPGDGRAHHALAAAPHGEEPVQGRRQARHRAGAALDERDGRRLYLPVPDADALVRPASAGRDRGGAVARL